MLRRAAAGAVAVALAVVAAPPHAAADEVREGQQDALRRLQTEQAWRTTRGTGVTVAVVDSGVDAGQRDLAGAVTTGPNMIASIDRGAAPARLHGTGMASLIAGRGHGPGRRDGVIGVAPQARILAIRAIAEPEDAGYARYRVADEARDSVARGIRYAVDNGADVINLSLGKQREGPAEREAIGYAISKNVVVVSAVGNDGDETFRLDSDGFAPYSYPASYPGVIAVAATAGPDDRAPFSNRNYSVLVAAPGVALPVAAPGNRYFRSSGTSSASAIVSGVAALIRSKHRELAPALVAQALVEGGRAGADYKPDLGYGEISASRALAAADRIAASPPDAGKKPGDRFGATAPGPVAIIERPAWTKPLLLVITIGGVLGAAAAVIVALTLVRRHPRTRRALAPPPHAGGPPR
ncbi:S8 family peptidase [Actinomadura flavalba]|uniref:S8 family peptidase n=1 Tax=Actinomadura flavalba TaxID=1120938 RepID=UPI00036FEC76|nr:S8 family serine peptidase [Actinomadura flavalba]